MSMPIALVIFLVGACVGFAFAEVIDGGLEEF
jgi:hypothetical protein